MHVVKTNILSAFLKTAPQGGAKDVSAWLAITKSANWLGPNDVRVDFPNAIQSNNDWSFPLKPSGTIVEVMIRFKTPTGVVVIQKVT